MSLLCDLFVCDQHLHGYHKLNNTKLYTLYFISIIIDLMHVRILNMAGKLGKVRRLHYKSLKLPSLKVIVEN